MLEKFNADDWSFGGQPFSIDSLRVAELMTSQNSTKIDTKLKGALNKLLAQVYEDD